MLTFAQTERQAMAWPDFSMTKVLLRRLVTATPIFSLSLIRQIYRDSDRNINMVGQSVISRSARLIRGYRWTLKHGQGKEGRLGLWPAVQSHLLNLSLCYLGLDRQRLPPAAVQLGDQHVPPRVLLHRADHGGDHLERLAGQDGDAVQGTLAVQHNCRHLEPAPVRSLQAE